MLDKQTDENIARSDFIACYVKETDAKYKLWGGDLAHRLLEQYEEGKEPEREGGLYLELEADTLEDLDELAEHVKRIKAHTASN